MIKPSIDEIEFAKARKVWMENELPIVLEILKDIMGNFEANKYPEWTWKILERYYKCCEWKLDPNINLKSVWDDTFIKDGELLEKLEIIPWILAMHELIQKKKAEKQRRLPQATEAVAVKVWWILGKQ